MTTSRKQYNMKNVDKFGITLTNSTQIYFPGQTVEGNVRFHNPENADVKGVYLEFTGISHVSWEEKHSKSRKAPVSNYTSLERYFHDKIDLAVAENGQSFVLTKGAYEFSFLSILPDEIPTSFEIHHGRVRYYLRAFIQYNDSPEVDTLIPITVLTFFDLNESPYAMKPIESDEERLLGCCCCTSGPILVKLKLKKMGHVPGERFDIDGECVNSTGKVLQQSYIDLIMSVTLKANDSNLVEENVVKSWNLDDIPAHSTRPLRDLNLFVPVVPPSGSRFCNNIDVHYSLKMTVNVPGNANITTSVGMIIGSIPLIKNINNANTQIVRTEETENNSITSEINVQYPKDLLPKEIAPPQYRKSDMKPVYIREHFPIININGEIQNCDRDNSDHERSIQSYKDEIRWNPLYPYYTFPTQTVI